MHLLSAVMERSTHQEGSTTEASGTAGVSGQALHEEVKTGQEVTLRRWGVQAQGTAEIKVWRCDGERCICNRPRCSYCWDQMCSWGMKLEEKKETFNISQKKSKICFLFNIVKRIFNVTVNTHLLILLLSLFTAPASPPLDI